MKLTSSAFQNQGRIPALYTCDGQGINPPLEIDDIPANTKSLAMIVEDPDVPKNLREDGLWIHWMIWNIPASTTGVSIGEGSTPSGVVGLSTDGRQAYNPMCPPDREHRYFFKVFALDTIIELDPNSATREDLYAALQNHVLETAELMGKYERVSG
jgi:hypothetical protein